jgi:hypothetical protein
MDIKNCISPDTVTRLLDLGHTINCSQRGAGIGSLHTVMWEDVVFCSYFDSGRPGVGGV